MKTRTPGPSMWAIGGYLVGLIGSSALGLSSRHAQQIGVLGAGLAFLAFVVRFAARSWSGRRGAAARRLRRREDETVRVFVSPTEDEMVHLIRRPDGTYGMRSFRRHREVDGWTPVDWGHWYDREETAVAEAAGAYAWIRDGLNGGG